MAELSAPAGPGDLPCAVPEMFGRRLVKGHTYSGASIDGGCDLNQMAWDYISMSVPTFPHLFIRALVMETLLKMGVEPVPSPNVSYFTARGSILIPAEQSPTA